MKRISIVFSLVIAASLSSAGCSKSFYGGAAVGAAGAGAAYEYQAHRAIEEVEKDYKDGKISKEEYERRKEEIRNRSLTQ